MNESVHVGADSSCEKWRTTSRLADFKCFNSSIFQRMDLVSKMCKQESEWLSMAKYMQTNQMPGARATSNPFE